MISLKILCRKNKGVTLIELLVVLAIIGVVSSLIYSMHLFGIRTFAKGESKSNVQFDARMTLDFITKEVRYASEVQILTNTTSIPANVTTEDCYIYSEASGTNQVIRYKDKLGTKVVATFNTINMNFSTLSNKTLRYNITGVYKGESFTIYSDVLPLNMLKSGSIINNNGIAIRYVKAATAATAVTVFLQHSPPNAYSGSAYVHNFGASGGKSPYSYSLSAGDLPPGLTLSSTGVLSGTPTTAGYYVFDVRAADSSVPSLSATRTFEVIIGSSSLTAANVAGQINNGTITFPSAEAGSPSVTLPTVPLGFTVVIIASDNPGIVALNGTITPPLVATQVKLTLRVISLINPNDTADTSQRTIMIQPGAINEPPKATDVRIIGGLEVGSTLTGSYVYSDKEGDAEGVSTTKWYRGNSPTDQYKQQILTATGTNYVTTTADLYKYIFFEVTPIASTGTTKGYAEISEPVQIISNANQAPVIKNLRIILKDGAEVTEASVGNILTIAYVWSDAEGDPEGEHIIKWIKIGNNNEREIETSKEYIVKNSDKNKQIYVEVTPRALTGELQGNTVTSTNVRIRNQ
jgi:prepilin-type N-terminal cleavage/methylation domain-containing protein